MKFSFLQRVDLACIGQSWRRGDEEVAQVQVCRERRPRMYLLDSWRGSCRMQIHASNMQIQPRDRSRDMEPRLSFPTYTNEVEFHQLKYVIWVCRMHL